MPYSQGWNSNNTALSIYSRLPLKVYPHHTRRTMGDGHDPRDHSCQSAPAAIPPTLSTKPLNQTAAATHSSNREVLLQGHNRGSPPKKFCFCFSPCILKLYSLPIQALFEERGLMPTTLKVIYDAIRHANGGPLVINWTHVTTVSFCKTICC